MPLEAYLRGYMIDLPFVGFLPGILGKQNKPNNNNNKALKL
jgi:hypothetical protein